MSRYVLASTAKDAKKRLPSPYRPPNQLAQVTFCTPETALKRLAYASGRGSTKPVEFMVTSRRALPNWAAAPRVVTTERSDANRKSASETLAIVRSVRRLCRPRLARRRVQNFM